LVAGASEALRTLDILIDCGKSNDEEDITPANGESEL